MKKGRLTATERIRAERTRNAWLDMKIPMDTTFKAGFGKKG